MLTDSPTLEVVNRSHRSQTNLVGPKRPNPDRGMSLPHCFFVLGPLAEKLFQPQASSSLML